MFCFSPMKLVDSLFCELHISDVGYLLFVVDFR